MIIVTLKTSEPESYLGLYNGRDLVGKTYWQAHRELSVTLYRKIEDLLSKNGKFLLDIDAFVSFAGPGSFTGLRIGLSAANALGYVLNVPSIATGGGNWEQDGIAALEDGTSEKIALPVYGSDAHATPQKK